jgi:hypothetical protein
LCAGLDEVARRSLVNNLTQYVAVQLLLMVSVGLAVVLTLAWRRAWTWQHPNPPVDLKYRPPRLIVAAAAEVLLLLYSAAMGVFTLWLAHRAGFHWPGWFELPAEELVTGSLVLMIAGIALFATGSRRALHILMDIINHFHRRGQRLSVLRRDGRTPVGAFVIRHQIEARFRRVLGELLHSHQPTNLAVIAHSQGTVVAIDVLRQKEWAAALDGLATVTLVTLGTPLSHIYQYYFPEQYPALADNHWQHLRASVDHWVNVFRLDDFVGTDVPGGEGAWPENRHVGYGGHAHYWQQAEVLKIIAEKLPGLVR